MTSARPRARWLLHPTTPVLVLAGLTASAVPPWPGASLLAAVVAGAAAGFANSGST